jgi:hypothetical protein
MPRIRVVRGVIVEGLPREVGDVLEVSPHVARLLVEAYHDAEYVAEVEQERIAVPEVEHRDPQFRRKR